MPRTSTVERLVRIVLALWVSGAIALQLRLVQSSWRELPLITLTACLGMAVLSWWSRRSVALVLVPSYVMPVLLWYSRGLQSSFYVVVWLAAVFGVMLPDLLRRPWALPPRWRVPLMYTALAVAISATVVVLREVEGVPLMIVNSGAVFWRGTPPAFTIMWVLHMALSSIVGILFFDWLFGAVELDFERAVVTPLTISAVMLALSVAYQVFVDARLFNFTSYYFLGRATGTMFDANVAGMLAAVWVGGVWLWAVRLGGWRLWLLPALVFLMAVAVWGTGSRSSLLVGLGGAAGIVVSLLLVNGRVELRRAVPLGLLLAGGLGALVVIGVNSERDNAIRRLASMFKPTSTVSSVAKQMWARDGYGTAAVLMIRDSPVSGVGVGAYHGLVASIGGLIGVWLPPDNAQNWLRHEVAELGLVGGAGWIAWYGLFAFSLCSVNRRQPSSIWIVRAMLVVFGLASLLGMPGQDAMMGLTFWVLAFWYAKLQGTTTDTRPLSRWMLAVGAVLLLTYSADAVLKARGVLRPVERAIREHRDFSYGYGPVLTDGPDSGFRVVQRKATTLVTADAPWMALSIRLDARAVEPTEVRVSVNHEVVLKATLTPGVPFTGVVDLDGLVAAPLLLETSAITGNRWNLRTTSDVLMKWEFVADVPSRFKVFR